MKKQEVKEIIDMAGELQASVALYKRTRDKLVAPLKKLFGVDTYVQSATGKYQAILSLDSQRVVDPLDVIDLYNKGTLGKLDIQRILAVRITEADEILTEELQKEVMKTKRNRKPTLHISKTAKEDV